MPILVNDELEVIAGHGRILAARRLGLDAVPVIRLAHLTPEQVRAYRIADNKLALDAGWDEELLAAEFHELNGAGYDLGLTGFSAEELDELLAPSATAAIWSATPTRCRSRRRTQSRIRVICGCSATTACSAATRPAATT